MKPKLGPCKRRFRLKWRDVLARRPLFCYLGYFFLLFRRFDSNLAAFGFHLSGSGTRLGSIWKVFGPIMVPSWRYLGPETEREIAREREERNIRKRKIERERERRREREKDRDRHIKASTTHTKLINIHTNVWGRRKARSHMYIMNILKIQL